MRTTAPSLCRSSPARRPAVLSTTRGTRWPHNSAPPELDTPELDARLLVGHAVNLDHAALVAAGVRKLGRKEADMINALARRRLGHEPVARILGRKEFWSLALAIDGATLVPRPETETIVEAVLAAIDAAGARQRPLRIADLGTGSGALILALLAELPNSTGVATDIDFGALLCARANARCLGQTRAAFVACDMAAALAGPFDVIVSNPPYVASDDIAALVPEVRDFDPRRALDGGADGLEFLSRDRGSRAGAGRARWLRRRRTRRRSGRGRCRAFFGGGTCAGAAAYRP